MERRVKAETWLNLTTGLALVAGAYLSAISAFASFGQPEPAYRAREGVAFLCTRAAVKARDPRCVDFRMICDCPLRMPPDPATVQVASWRPEPVSRTAMLNNLEAIKLAGRTRRPAIEL